MAYTLGILKTRSFEEWKEGFEAPENVAWRKEAGGGAARIFRVEGEPNTVVVLIEWESLERAKKHAESAKLREIHSDLLLAPPQFYYLEAV